MKKLFFILVGLCFILITNISAKVVDDWEYNATEVYKESMVMPSGAVAYSPIPMPSPLAKSAGNIGLSVGGAKDANNFKENIQNGYLPKINSITYEGVFYGHFFDTALKGECKELFCPSYNSTTKINPFTKNKEIFLSVGLNSDIKQSEFKRKKLNLVIVLDISGSMGSGFDSYYYDGKEKDKEHKTKIQIANESIVAMLSHLKGSDREGMILFDDGAYRALKLKSVGERDQEKVKKHILDITDRGGTNWSAGYKAGLELFDNMPKDSDYENRIIFLTDAMPNTGELDKDGLFGMAKDASERGIHTTFVGIGVDFNNDLVEYVSKIKGANYHSVHSSEKFSKLLDDEFEYMVTPLVYDLSLKLDGDAYSIAGVYGSPEANMATGEIMKVNTLFPSKATDEATKGGVILLKLNKNDRVDNQNIKLIANYKDVNGKSHTNEQNVYLTDSQNSGIQKAILLSDYVSLMKNWLIDTRASCNDKPKWIYEKPVVLEKRIFIYPPLHPMYPFVSEWERGSCNLNVSKNYKEVFNKFANYYKLEMNKINDKSLNEELEIINLLEKSKETNPNQDDWEMKK
ncbi:MAG: VWA domain-containing protein [Sulfurovaceae bacterium]|nr:VWA domain-containing protein [Sulfurovaceae bacterium]MDD5548282.1 VWA domain-containing protein [Sulfurovaceae bacterium]